MFLGVERPWTQAELEAVIRHLTPYLAVDQPLPGKQLIEQCVAAESCLKDRTWLHIKDYCRRHLTR